MLVHSTMVKKFKLRHYPAGGSGPVRSALIWFVEVLQTDEAQLPAAAFAELGSVDSLFLSSPSPAARLLSMIRRWLHRRAPFAAQQYAEDYAAKVREDFSVWRTRDKKADPERPVAPPPDVPAKSRM
jgi:hypothetical protein